MRLFGNKQYRLFSHSLKPIFAVLITASITLSRCSRAPFVDSLCQILQLWNLVILEQMFLDKMLLSGLRGVRWSVSGFIPVRTRLLESKYRDN